MNLSTCQKLNVLAQFALSNQQTVYNSYDIARLALERGVQGDFVECGVFAGTQAAAMSLAILDVEGIHSRRRVHMFDSFEGIPKAGPRDKDFKLGGHKPGTSACSLEAVQKNMADWGIDPGLLVYHPGWFSDTLPADDISYIAVLRLDGDLYDSTKVCMDYLYPFLARNGFCIVDDFALDGARAAVTEYLEGGFPPIIFQKP